MREQTRLSVVDGMFHEWDRQLRDWLVREIHHWHRGNHTPVKVWSVDFMQIGNLLECFGWPLRTTDYIRTLDACRLVVNVYKHGKRKSLDDLTNDFPEYLDDPSKIFHVHLLEAKNRESTHEPELLTGALDRLL